MTSKTTGAGRQLATRSGSGFRAVAAPASTRWWKSSRFWFFALPLVTGGLASWVPPLWVASKVQEGQLKARLYVTAAAAAVLALIGGAFVGSAPASA